MTDANQVRDFLISSLKSAREDVELFAADFIKLVKALAVWSIPFCLSIIVISILPSIFASNIGKLTDAVIGARGVGTMTIDVTRAIHVLTGAAIAGFLAEMFLSRFEGKASVMSSTAYSVGALVILAVMLLNLGWFGVAVWPILLIVVRIALKKIPYLQYLFVLPVIFLFLSCANHVIQYASIRAVTVGSAMSTVAAAGMYAVVAAGIMLKRT